jgi:hypothetical protein
MATDWYYSKNGQQCGPVSSSKLKALAGAGQLLPTDLIWKEGLAAWQPATRLKGLFAAPTAITSVPPVRQPQVAASAWQAAPTPEVAQSALDWPNLLLWAYRLLLVAAVVSIASPWYTISGEASAPVLGAVSSRASVTGLSVAMGIIALLLLLGGGVTSFLTKAWKIHCGLAAAAFGLAAIAALQLNAGGFGVSAHSSFGGATATARAGLAWGIWLTLLASALAAGAGYAAGAPAAQAWLKEHLDKSVAKKAIITIGCVAALGLLLVLVSSGTNLPAISSTSTKSQLSEAQARRRLTETAEKYDGIMALGVKNGLERLDDDHGYSISMQDEYMENIVNHRFTPETMTAYRVWRAAWMAEKGN